MHFDLGVVADTNNDVVISDASDLDTYWKILTRKQPELDAFSDNHEAILILGTELHDVPRVRLPGVADGLGHAQQLSRPFLHDPGHHFPLGVVLLTELSGFMDISTVEQPSGSVDVFVGNLPIAAFDQ